MIDKDRMDQYISNYVQYVKRMGLDIYVNEQEGYKFEFVANFQRYFDINAKDFKAMLDTSIQNTNLVSGSQYYPRKMLLIFAEEFEDETKKALMVLFNEKLDIKERIDNSRKLLKDIMKKINTRDSTDHHAYMDLRFLSVLLSTRFPTVFYPYKNAEYQTFTNFIDTQFKEVIKGTSHSPGIQYEIYKKYTDSLCDRIKIIPEISRIHSKFTENTSFKDPEYKWMTQDVIYTGARALNTGPSESVQEFLQLVSRKKQVILYGPPGTGKTYITRFLSSEIIESGGRP